MQTIDAFYIIIIECKNESKLFCYYSDDWCKTAAIVEYFIYANNYKKHFNTSSVILTRLRGVAI